MIGAIIGDIVGSRFEFNNYRAKDFELFGPGCDFTDDTILTIATAEAILNGGRYRESYVNWARRYPRPKGAYGASVARWISDPVPSNSFGNGAGMRVSPVGWAFEDEAKILEEARRSAAVSHDHPEGIKGAQAIALGVWILRRSGSKEELVERLGSWYDLSGSVEEIRKTNRFDETCQVTVPQAIVCFLEAESFEDTIRNAVSIGGDSDTIGAMAGALGEAYFGVPSDLKAAARGYLPGDMIGTLDRFEAEYGPTI